MNRLIAPVGEWPLDNFHLIKEQIRTTKKHLPKGCSRELSRLLSGPWAGLPRVYDIALETVYYITIRRAHDASGGMSVAVDGLDQQDNAIPLVDYRQEYKIEVRIPIAGTQLFSLTRVQDR